MKEVKRQLENQPMGAELQNSNNQAVNSGLLPEGFNRNAGTASTSARPIIPMPSDHVGP